MRAIAALLVVLAAGVLAGLSLGGGTAGAAGSRPLLGLTGDPARFKGQTGQETLVRQAFLGWGQGLSYGSPFAALLPTLAPVPMLHLGTAGRNGKETITPADIAVWNKAIYVRPMAEMNNPANPYAGYSASGAPRDAAHSPASYRKAFARIYVILHGGTAAQVNAKLRGLGLPPLAGGTPLANPFPRLRVLWSPLAGGNPRVPGNAPEQYYPGSRYVDVEGGDIYEEQLGDTAPWDGLEALYRSARSHGKPFSVPEWGLFRVDDEQFVRHMCTFVQTHAAVENAVFFSGRPGSIFDLASKPRSRAAYAQCLTPLGGQLPSWAAANAPGAGPGKVTLKLTPQPPSGASPLAVQFSISAKLSVPVAHWQVVFGDGAQAGGSGAPPTRLRHSYARDGAYQAVLFVFQAPPFTLADALAYTAADVTAGTAPPRLVSFVPSVTGGAPPLAVSFRTDLTPPARASSWTIVFGDGTVRTGTGAPPHFTGHTFATAGSYQVLLLLSAPGGAVFAAVAPIAPGGGGGGAPPRTTTTRPTTTTTTTTTTTRAPPPTGRPTGTVLVNGRPFTGGTIPYGSVVNVTKGRLRLVADTGTVTLFAAGGKPAIFVVRRGTSQGRPLVELRLTGGNFRVCPKRKKSSAVAGPATVVRQLWGNGKGRFQTRGRYAAATVRGTFWLTADRCDGTQVRVRVGVVRVADIPRRRQVTVRAGRSYLARP